MKEFKMINGVNICYEVVGQGKNTILMLHGNGEKMSVFDELVSQLSSNYRIVLMDSRGHGKSKLNKEILTLELIKKDALELMKFLNIENYIIFGFSDGANVSLMISLENPNIKGMILVSPNLTFKDLKWQLKAMILMRCLCLIPLCIYHPGARLEWKRQMLMIKEPNLNLTEIERIKAPVLLFGGQFDLIKREHFKDIATHLPFCKYHEIEHATHYMIKPLNEILLKESKLFLDCLD